MSVAHIEQRVVRKFSTAIEQPDLRRIFKLTCPTRAFTMLQLGNSNCQISEVKGISLIIAEV